MITFRCDDGSIHECLLPGSYCDEGERASFVDDDGVEREGVRLVVAFDGGLRTKGIACVTRQFQIWDPDLKKHDREGNGVIETRRDYEDVIARKRDKGQKWVIE